MERSNELSIDEAFLQSLTKIVYENLNNDQFGAEELARQIGISRSQIHRKLQRILGKSVTQFVREIRLEEAKKLLIREIGTASEISFRVGFSSPAYFTKCFHEYFGYPPSEIKKHPSKAVTNQDYEQQGADIIPISRNKEVDKEEDKDFRKLTTILFTDISGYSSIMGENEHKALQLLHKNRKMHQSLLDLYHGELIKEIGDAVMASFESPSDAVHCAQQIISASEDIEGLKLHIGIHLGEVYFTEGDIYGDGVNIASRINTEAKEGEVLVSEDVFRSIRNKVNIKVERVGIKHFKNVKEPQLLYRLILNKVSGNYEKKLSHKNYADWDWKKVLMIALVLFLIASVVYYFLTVDRIEKDREKAIVVSILPLNNLGEDKKFDYLSYGLADNLMSNLCQVHQFKVVSDKSSFLFYKQNRSYSDLAKKMGVKNIVEGNYDVRDSRIEINLRIVDAASGQIINSRSFEEDIQKLHTLQNDMAFWVSESSGLDLAREENLFFNAEKINLTAFEYFERGKDILRTGPFMNINLLEESKNYFYGALQSNSEYFDAYLGLCEASLLEIINEINPGIEVLPKLENWISKARKLNPESGELFVFDGIVAMYNNDWKQARILIDKGIELNPNYANAYWFIAWTYAVQKNNQHAVELMDMAIQLDPMNLHYQLWKSIFLSFAGEYERAQSILDIYTKIDSIAYWAYWCQGINFLQQNELEKAYNTFYLELPSQWKCSWTNYTYGKMGDINKVEKILEQQLTKYQSSYSSPFEIAVTFLGMNEIDSTLYYLDIAYEMKDNYAPFLVNASIFNPIRDHPRFQEILKNMGLSGS